MSSWKARNVESAPSCPRCASTNTKFCYFNNYSLAQPRYFCKSCRRYWTKGGALRNVPVGGGCRKNRRAGIQVGAESMNDDRSKFVMITVPQENYPITSREINGDKTTKNVESEDFTVDSSDDSVFNSVASDKVYMHQDFINGRDFVYDDWSNFGGETVWQLEADDFIEFCQESTGLIHDCDVLWHGYDHANNWGSFDFSSLI